jgi:hypothetical protein
MYVTGFITVDGTYGSTECLYAGTYPYPDYFANYAGTASTLDV